MLAASMGIQTTRTSASTIVHSFSYPLGLMVNLSHGRACALMLPYVMEFNLMGNPDKFAMVAELLGERVQGMTTSEKAVLSVVAVKKLIADLRLPSKLGEVGIKKTDIPEIVDYVVKYHSYQMANNPRIVERSDLEHILESAL
jgi:alcohol dehydrogenase class IV